MVHNFFLWLSGAERPALRRCPSETTKMVCLGGAVLFTAGIAAAACTITLSSFLDVPLLMALAVGLLWGVGILNFDRWAVSAMRRQKGGVRTFLQIVPRLILAGVVGLVIAEPIVLKVFDQEIEAQAVRTKGIDQAERRAELDKEFAVLTKLQQEEKALQQQLGSADVASLISGDPRYARLTAELADLKAQLPAAEQAVICETEGGCGTMKAGAGPAAKQKQALLDDIRRRIAGKETELRALEAGLEQDADQAQATSASATSARLATIRKDIERLSAQRLAAEEAFNGRSNHSIGLLDRIEALSTLGRENPEMGRVHMVLRMFIWMLDSLPVLLKAMMFFGKRSLYETTLEEMEEERLESNRREAEARRTAGARAAQLQEQRAVLVAGLEQASHARLSREAARVREAVARQLLQRYEAVAAGMAPDYADSMTESMRHSLAQDFDQLYDELIGRHSTSGLAAFPEAEVVGWAPGRRAHAPEDVPARTP